MRRFARYGEALRHHHDRSLTLVYPVLHALVGDAFFRALAHSYGDAHPSCDGDLSGFGAHLPEFLSDYSGARRYPYFVDVARVEWLLHEAHGAADGQPLTAADVAKADPSSVGRWALRLHPSVALHESAWTIGAIVLAHREPSNYALRTPRPPRRKGCRSIRERCSCNGWPTACSYAPNVFFAYR